MYVAHNSGIIPTTEKFAQKQRKTGIDIDAVAGGGSQSNQGSSSTDPNSGLLNVLGFLCRLYS